MFESGSTIIPVFYGVEPADLRWRTQGEKGVYGQSLQKLEKKRTHDSQPRYDPSTIQKWRKALIDAAEIKGFDKKTYNGDEQQLLEQVVEGVLKKVKRPLHVSRYPTGLDEKVAEFEGEMSLDQQSSGETRVIGIVGLGGAGKTTLAKEIFNRRRSNYKKSYFQFDVRENSARNSLKSVQSMILSGLAQVNVAIDSTDDGLEKLQRYLKSSHAFLILDDVDHLQQVEALLLPVKDALQQGSLILVTSRNKDVLTRSGIAEFSIFKLKGLDQHHSQELFCCHAFDQRDPPLEFKQVVEEFVDACAGLPLSLKVLGSLLRGKDLKYGKELLHDISKILPEDIMATLKISYDMSRCSLQVLPDWLGNLTNLRTIEMSQCSSLQVLPDSLGNLTNLGTIDMSWCSSLRVLPDSLGNLTNLGTIDMSQCSSLQVLPDSLGNLTNLGTIDMSWCSSLRVLPDSLGNLTNLRTINMSGCSRLQMLPDSLGNLTNLGTIDMSGCLSLQVLPDSFGNLIQLERLKFDRLTVSYEVYEKMHTFK